MPVDVHVEFGQAPQNLPNAVHRYTFADADIKIQVDGHGDVLMHTATARYHVVGGQTVLIDADPALQPHALRDMVLYYCLPALLNQRGAFALHANAICTPRGAIVLAGSSGGGKSTLHAALLGRGMAMLSDDVAVLRSRADGYDVLPGTRRYRMTADAWERMKPPAEQVIPLDGPRKKVALLAPTSLHHNKSAPLAAIYLLEPYAGEEIIVERLQGVAAFRLLQHKRICRWIHGAAPASALLQHTGQPHRRLSDSPTCPPLDRGRTRRHRATCRSTNHVHPLMADIVWLASYPKSGNTWTRSS